MEETLCAETWLAARYPGASVGAPLLQTSRACLTATLMAEAKVRGQQKCSAYARVKEGISQKARDQKHKEHILCVMGKQVGIFFKTFTKQY